MANVVDRTREALRRQALTLIQPPVVTGRGRETPQPGYETNASGAAAVRRARDVLRAKNKARVVHDFRPRQVGVDRPPRVADGLDR